MASLAITTTFRLAAQEPTERGPARASIYVGYVARLSGGQAWLRQESANKEISLSPKNARGRLIFSTTEIRCEPLATLSIDQRWGAGITNLSSTNWTRLAPSGFRSPEGDGRLVPAGSYAVDFARGRWSEVALLLEMMRSTMIAAMVADSHRPRVWDWRKEAKRLLAQVPPDYPGAAKTLEEWRTEYARLRPGDQEALLPLSEAVQVAEQHIRQMRRQAAINVLEDCGILIDRLRMAFRPGRMYE